MNNRTLSLATSLILIAGPTVAQEAGTMEAVSEPSSPVAIESAPEDAPQNRPEVQSGPGTEPATASAPVMTPGSAASMVRTTTEPAAVEAIPEPQPVLEAQLAPERSSDPLTDTALGLNGLFDGILAHYAEMKDTVLNAIEEGSHDHMSPVGMFMAADWVVKAVMLSLAFASVATWAIFAAKLIQLWSRKRGLTRQYRRLDRAGALDQVTGRLAKGRGIVGRMVASARDEVARSGSAPAFNAGIKERTSSVLSRIEVGAARRMGAGTGILANIGSTAPFVGLFGTVWGIMNSFISIAESNTTNLAVVAPGIAEALLATAIGLVAAIPAVIFYNLLSRGLGGYRVMLGDAAALVERTLSRDLDRQTAEPGLQVADEPDHGSPAYTPTPLAEAAE